MDTIERKNDSELGPEIGLRQTQAGDSLHNDESNELLNGDQPKEDESNESVKDRSDETQPDEHPPNESDSDTEQDRQKAYELKCGQPDNPGDDFSSPDWLDLLDNREIFKRILFTKVEDPQNPTLPRPSRGCKATINLETKLYSTQQPIASECFTGLDVIVGYYDVIHGVDLILPMMHLHEKTRVVISPRFGYGNKGRLPDVEPNSRLDCIVELLAIQDDLDELPNDEKISLAEMKKIRGNFWFAREEYQSAVTCYRKCIELLESLDFETLDQPARRLLIDTHNNLSLTYIRIESFNEALESVNQVLGYEPKNVKALFRKAQILENKCDLQEAVELLKTAIELEPNNTSVANQLTKLRKRRLIELENEKRMYQKMISANQPDVTVVEEEKVAKSVANKLKSKTFNYTVFAASALIALLIAFLINQYLSNYT